MASFEEHLRQVRHNTDFLHSISRENTAYWDWKVTTTFYIAVHLINAHLAKSNEHYRNHMEVSHALNPCGKNVQSKLPETPYLAYEKLSNLSRRSRYLINENIDDKSIIEHLTYDRHYSKALRQLNALLDWFSTTYGVSFTMKEVYCPEIASDLKYFCHKHSIVTSNV